MELLLASAAQEDVPIYVVLTMRSDYLGDCNLFAGLPEALNDSQFLTPRLTRDQRREAIEAPALVFEGRVEPALVNRLLNDMDAGPDQLPLMQHALMRLWTRAGRAAAPLSDGAPRQREVMLTLADYEAIGGLKMALSGHADEVFDRLDEGQRTIAEVLFRGLSERGAEGRDIRRPTPLRSVAEVAGVPVERVVPVVEAFRHPDLSVLVPPPPTPLEPETILDISHESLIRQWHRLRAWAEAEANSADMYRRLEKTASLWRMKRAGLWDTPDLDFALEWKARERPNAAWARRYGGDFEGAMLFLSNSRKAQKRKLAAEQERRAAELEAARRLAEAAEERRRVEEERAHDAERAAMRLRRLVVALVAVAAVAVVLAVAAFIQRNQASRAGVLATKLAEEAREQTQDGRAANPRSPPRPSRRPSGKPGSPPHDSSPLSRWRSETNASTARSYWRSKLSRPRTHWKHAKVFTKPFSKDQDSRRSCTSMRAGLRAWPSARTARPSRPDSGDISGGVVLWDVAARKRLVDEPLPVKEGQVESVAFSPDGKTIAAGFYGDIGGGVVLWDVAARKRLVDEPLPVKEGHVGSVAFSPDGTTIAAGFWGGIGGGVVLWDVAARKRLVDEPLPVKEGDVESVAFSPDGKTIAAGFWRRHRRRRGAVGRGRTQTPGR